ncbi:MAG TPA: V-type ATPase subunit [Myxococcales bacterium]|nr:V-type ATPase subunit [Myxococcales bacterium]
MTVSWDDLNARAQGLSTRLLGRRGIEALATAAGIDELARLLDRAGFGPVQLPATPERLESALRVVAADRLRILARWSGERAGVLAVVFEDEDRRSLRALARGAASSAPPETRLAGLVPTPSLPQRALDELARLTDVARLAATLRAWSNPYAAAFDVQPGLPRPDLLHLETALVLLFAQRASAGARRGDRALAEFIEDTIDAENVYTALMLAPHQPNAWFVPGGRALGPDAFAEAVRAPDRAQAARRLAAAFAGTPLHGAIEGPLSSLERRMLAARVLALGKAARREPLTSKPLLSFALRLRAEILDLQAVIWSVALGAPARDVQLASPP